MAIRVTVDVVLFTIQQDELFVLLVERGIPPFKGMWAIPGGFVLEHESLEEAAARELSEETGVRDLFIEPLGAFGDPGRDPRGRVVTVAYFALVAFERMTLAAGTDAAAARFFAVRALPALAFDHARIVDAALARLRDRLSDASIAFQLLPPEFTLTELQRVHEAVLSRPLDKRNFRRKLAGMRGIRALRRYRTEGVRRPARLYAFAGARPPRPRRR